MNRFHSHFADAFVPIVSRLGLLMGKLREFIIELWHLSMYKKCFWLLVPLLFWSMTMKLHKNDQSNKSSILA